jgi:hypothetical protein
MSRDSATGGSPATDSSLVSSIVVVIFLMIVVTTTVSYAAIQASAGSASASATSSPTITSSSPSTSTSLVPVSPAILQWGPSQSYPVSVWTQSCVESAGYIYCVGGLSGPNTVTDSVGAVYYAPISPLGGVGNWTVTTSYPTSIRSESCVTNAGTIYCVGGYAGSTLSDDVYYATLSSTGVGPWTNTTSYPFPLWNTACVASSSGIYCAGGGIASTSSLSSSSAVYFAPFSSSGIGKWASTASYPVGVKQQTCAASGSDIYCVGGYESTDVYYAPLSTSGVGAWVKTTGYPFTVGANLASCVIIGDTIYCVGGHTGSNVSSDAYYATISSTGVGEWVNGTGYPVGVWGESCVVASGRLYCVGGETESGSIVNEVFFSNPT